MSIETIDYLDVEQRSLALGIKAPEGFCILPRRFEHAQTVSDLCHESSALDVKALLRQANLPITIYQPDGTQIPYLQENDNTWIGPVLFFSMATLIENPHILGVALGVIANYATDIFRGSPEPGRARLSVVIETSTTKTTKKTTKKIDYDGPHDKINDILSFIKDIK